MDRRPYETIELDVSDGVWIITLNRPKRLNAAVPKMLDELIEAIEMSNKDDTAHAVVVTGRGRAFCAGADLVDDRPDLSQVSPEDYEDGGGRAALAVFESDKPIIAAINGPAVGFGVTLTLPMDIRMAAEEARFALPFTRRGIVPESCATWFLPRVVGIGKALEWITTGRTFEAQEALDAGLVRSLHARDDVLAAAVGLAREIADHTSPVSVAMSRRMIWRMQAAASPADAHQLESRMLYERLRSPDSQEGMDAFLQKRSPRFSGSVTCDVPSALR